MKTKTKTKTTIKASLLLGCSFTLLPLASAQASDPALYKVLLENNVITQAQYEKLMKTKDVKASINPKGKLKFQSETGDFQYQLGGRIMTDAAFYNDDVTDLASGTEFRRTRLFVKGRMYKNWIFKANIDWAGNATAIKDMYLGYDFDPMVIRFGQFGESGGMEDISSSKYITFMERSLPHLAFAPAARRIGVALNTYGNNWSWAGGIFGEGDSADGGDDEGSGFSTRLTYTPWRSGKNMLHLGASFQARDPETNTLRFRARPEAHIDSTRFVNTGTMEAIDSYTTSGLELAMVNGPFSFQSEYLTTGVDRKNGLSDLDFDGYYLYGSWFVTGEYRPYDVKSGTFGRVKPKRNISQGGIGAWELALRFSHLDLNDNDIRGGKESNTTLGLNWYVNPNIRFMFNYIYVDADNDVQDEDFDLFQTRAQIDF